MQRPRGDRLDGETDSTTCDRRPHAHSNPTPEISPMSIESLIEIAPPPSEPVDAGPLPQWAMVQIKLGLELPSDLLKLAVLYGTGSFSRGQFSVLNPFAPSYVETVTQICAFYRTLKEAEGDDYFPYDFYPQRPGLLPWGREANGHEMFWLTEGAADDWPLVLYRSGACEFERAEMSLTDYLGEVLTNRSTCTIFSGMRLEAEFEPAGE